MIATKLIFDTNFNPVSIDEGDELFPNGIFEFNITKIIDFIKNDDGQITLEVVNVEFYRNLFTDGLDEETIERADLSRPVILAEIAPKRYNLIDGHHRMERAYRENVLNLPAYKLHVQQHLNFLTSKSAYQAFINYWNLKLIEDR